MSEWEEKLNTLLSDPDAMAQVMNMAQNLSQQMGQSGGSAPPLRGLPYRIISNNGERPSGTGRIKEQPVCGHRGIAAAVA